MEALEFEFITDFSQAFVELKNLKTNVVEINKAIKTTKTKLDVVKFESFKTFHYITKGAKALVHAISGMLSPLQSSILNMIFVVVESLAAIATAQYSNPFTAGFAVATSIASATLGIVAAAQAEAGFEKAAASTAQADNLISNWMSGMGGI